MPGLLDRVLELDHHDELASFADRFAHPARAGSAGRATYLVGNSLGLQPLEAGPAVQRVMDAWSRSAVDGHFDGDRPWYRFEEPLEDIVATIVGARPDEVALANGLTANLHLLLASFYRPTAGRPSVAIERGAFPSDRYAVQTHVAWRGHDPDRSVVEVGPNPSAGPLEPDHLAAVLAARPDIGLVVLGGVNFHSGHLLDMAAMTSVAHEAGCPIVLDLAHAAGNVPLALHDWDVDAAAWCTYKYLNGGPGSVAGLFVHQRHSTDLTTPRLGGWWGNDPETRFSMNEHHRFVPRPGADGWKLSNPPILALAPLAASLPLFLEAGLERLRTKSMALTGFLYDGLVAAGFDVVTPVEPERRGAQVSVRVQDGQDLLAALARRGVMADFRAPDIIRLSPTPLYNSFADAAIAVTALSAARADRGS